MEPTIAWVPAVFNRELGLSAGAAGNVFAVVAIVGGLLGPLAGGWCADAAYRRRDISGRLLVCAAAAGMLAIAMSLVGTQATRITVPTLVAASFCICALSAVGMTVVQETLPPSIRGFTTGMIYAASGLLAGAGPTLVAAVSQGIGTTLGVAITLVAAPAAFTAMLLFLLALRRWQRAA